MGKYCRGMKQASGSSVATATVTVDTRRRAVLPQTVHRALKLKPGDVLTVRVQKESRISAGKTALDRRLAKAMRDIDEGRGYGPFNSVEEFLADLHSRARQLQRT